jgi:uncharacterized repeat protein (TIGR04076 family)
MAQFRANVRITVMKRLLLQDMVEENATGPWQACDRLRDGQEFISDTNMPEGFCSWAWVDIQKYVITLARGGNFIGSKAGRTVVCCSDGYRPVIFRLERLDETEESP